jgi:hypothetical protein
MASHEHEKDPLLTGQYDVYFEPTQNNSKVGTATAGDEETAASSSSAQQHQHRQFVPLLIPTNSLLSGASGSLSSPPRVVYKTAINCSSSHRRAHSTLEGGVIAPLATGGGEADSFAGTVSEAATIGSAALHLHDDGPDPPRSGDSGGKDGTGSRFFLYFVYAMVRTSAKDPRFS